MNPQRITGTVLMLIGIIMLIIGINASHSVADQWSSIFTGHFTETTVWYIILGGAGTLVGLMIVLFGVRGSHARG